MLVKVQCNLTLMHKNEIINVQINLKIVVYDVLVFRRI